MAKLTYPEELAVAAVEWNRLDTIATELRQEKYEVERKCREAERMASNAFAVLVELAKKAEVQLVQ